MTDRMVHIYALEHDNRAYVGSALDIGVRLRAHLEGTGAKCTSEWIAGITPALPDLKILGEYPENTRTVAEEAWIIEYARRGWVMVNRTFKVCPIDVEAWLQGMHRVHAMNKADGYRAQRRGARSTHEIQKAGGWEDQRRAGSRGARNQPVEVKRQNGRKLADFNRANGYEGSRRSIRKMPIEAMRRGGRLGGPRGTHTRWHVNRGITSPDCALCQDRL